MSDDNNELREGLQRAVQSWKTNKAWPSAREPLSEEEIQARRRTLEDQKRELMKQYGADEDRIKLLQEQKRRLLEQAAKGGIKVDNPEVAQ